MVDFARIRAVLFDLDGTLYRQTPLRALMALELATLPLTGPIKARQRLIALRAYRSAQERLRGSGTDPISGAQIAAAAAASGLAVAEVSALVDDWMMTRPLKYLQFCRARGLSRLLDVLANRGLRTGVLSDYPAAAKLRALGVDGRFSPVLCASDPAIGAFKPSPRGYLQACAIWKLSPDQVVFVGDRADVDAAGAAAAGMPCVIIGRRKSDRSGHGQYDVLPTLERLSDVIHAS